MSVVKKPSSQNLCAPSDWLEQLDEVCDRFESAWLAGERPHVEDFLADVSDKHNSEATRELLKLEAHYRQKGNETPTVEELRQRFPSLGSVWLRGEPQPSQAAARLIKTVAHAIQFAHTRAIIHHDLKPANILLETPGRRLVSEPRTAMPSSGMSVRASQPVALPEPKPSSLVEHPTLASRDYSWPYTNPTR